MNNLKTNLLYFFCALTIILFILLEVLAKNTNILNSLVKISSIGLSIFWLVFMMVKSKIHKTIFGKLLLISIVIIITGFIFQFHLRHAGYAIMLGLIGIMITYAIRYIFKKNKQLLDLLKLIWIATNILVVIFVLLHRIPIDSLIICKVLFIVLICTFTVDYNRRYRIIN